MARRSFRIRARFALVLAALIPAVLVVGAVGLRGMQAEQDAANSLYRDHLLTTQAVDRLVLSLDDTHQTVLELLLANTGTRRDRLAGQLLTDLSPQVERGLSTVTAASAGDDAEAGAARVIATQWTAFQKLLAAGAFAGITHEGEQAAADELARVLEPASDAALLISNIEARQARKAHADATHAHETGVEWTLIAALLGLLAAVGVVAWLTRSVLPRTLSYSAFAVDLGRGRYAARLNPTGDDELAQLGRVLDDLAERRQTDDAYEQNHRELIDSLQLTETEQEAHDLVKRHIERTLAGGEVTVLNRNNSADRLQAVTAVSPDSALAAGLRSAKPRSCLAIRKAQPHCSTSGQDNLLDCQVCSGSSPQSTCTPLIVRGEVIGSVLAGHDGALDDTQQRAIREAVTQAAPVIGNLRNLAIAELRAATDSLTGLPNKRAIQDSMRRMVAQASRTVTPIAALMCDLDHFKQINDRFGHGCGDDVLAATGAALTGSLRESDFAGRYGGEEFLVLLPGADAETARIAADKLRASVAAINIPTVDRPITLSVGIAVLPDHAGDAEALCRAADRALYAAKNNGRDRCEVVTTNGTHQALPPTPVPPTPAREVRLEPRE